MLHWLGLLLGLALKRANEGDAGAINLAAWRRRRGRFLGSQAEQLLLCWLLPSPVNSVSIASTMGKPLKYIALPRKLEFAQFTGKHKVHLKELWI
jgi:hypothetical protein